MHSAFKLINVLQHASYNDCHIKGSINVPLGHLAEYAQELDKTTEIVVYCAHYQCHASRNAWYLLHSLGFTHLYDYRGGMREWYQKKLPSEGACLLESWHHVSEPEWESESSAHIISAEDLLKKLKYYALI